MGLLSVDGRALAILITFLIWPIMLMHCAGWSALAQGIGHACAKRASPISGRAIAAGGVGADEGAERWWRIAAGMGRTATSHRNQSLVSAAGACQAASIQPLGALKQLRTRDLSHEGQVTRLALSPAYAAVW